MVPRSNFALAVVTGLILLPVIEPLTPFLAFPLMGKELAKVKEFTDLQSGSLKIK